jgi:hypothetical protein
MDQGEQPVGVALARDQRLQDRPPAQAHDVGQHRAELEVGVLQRLLQALDVAGLLADQLLAGARAKARSAWVAGSGTKLGRISPCASKSASQAASATSVLRPGTFLTRAALASTSVRSPSPSTCQTGFQCTPVASITAWGFCQLSRQT